MPETGGVVVLLAILAIATANPFGFATKQTRDGDQAYDFAVCESQCSERVLRLVRQTCGDDVTCVKTAGGVGGRLCSLACHGEDLLIDLAHKSKTAQGPTPTPKPDIVGCILGCVGEFLTKWDSFISKCGKDWQCWVESVAMEGMRCGVKCMPRLDKHVGESASLNPMIEVTERDFACWVGCIKESADKIGETVLKCNIHPWCYVAVFGIDALQCISRCLPHKEAELMLVTEELGRLIPAKPLTAEPKTGVAMVGDDYVKCWAKCLGKSVEEVEKWVEKCHTDVKCWLKVAGFDALKCAAECIKLDEAELMLVTEELSRLIPAKPLTVEPETRVAMVGDDYVKCWAKCLGKSVEEVEKWVEKCHTDVKCWLKVAGFDAIKCAAECIKLDETELMPATKEISRLIPAEPETGVAMVGDDYVKCWAKCLGKSVEEVEKWVEKCHTDVKCWLKVAGFDAIKCAAECIKLDDSLGEVSGLVSLKPEVTELTVSDPYVECWAKCLGKSAEQIKKWVAKCQRKVKCWIKVAGFAAVKCAGKCIKLDDSLRELPELVSLKPEVTELTVSDPYVECWAKCLGKSVEQIKKWVAKCHRKIKCWIKVAGFAATKCAAKCIKLDEAERSDTVAIIRVMNLVQLRSQYAPLGRMVRTSPFVKCWAKCLGKSVEEVEEWVKKCHTDIKCWIEVAGVDALKCAAECIKSRDTNREFQYLK